MKTLPLLVAAMAIAGCPAAAAAGWSLGQPTLQARVTHDDNPVGASGTSAAVLGAADTFVYAFGATVGAAWTSVAPGSAGGALTYAGESVRFTEWEDESFTSHRVSLTGQARVGAWRWTAAGSTFFVDGSRATLLSVASINANSVTFWRERRRQAQHRLKLQAQAEFGRAVVRGTAGVIADDYRTRAVVGRVGFTDRSDLQAGAEVGWKQNASSLWLAGVRVGRQEQATLPLPNCEFEYSNEYTRLALGWEGAPCAGTKVSFAAGPDFRRYTGAVDERIFLGGRGRTSLWFEGSFSSKLSPTVTLTGKAVRMNWLSSTGKSAYIDSCAETGLTWTATPAWSLRVSAKVHQCDYFPAARDDWEFLGGCGVTWQVSPRVQLTADVLSQRAWNGLPEFAEREFERLVAGVGAAIRL